MAAAAGLLLCSAWYYTIIAGFYILYCPVMYIMFFNHKLYRKLSDILFALWELYPVALFQCWFKTNLHHFGDYVDPDENTIIVMNHRTRVDWNYVWIALYHATQNNSDSAHFSCLDTIEKRSLKSKSRNVWDIISGGESKIKFVLKDEIKLIPGMGWIMQLNFFLYLKRDWREDQVNMARFVDYYKKLQYKCRMVLFPEGTDLSNDNKQKSNKFANVNGLPILNVTTMYEIPNGRLAYGYTARHPGLLAKTRVAPSLFMYVQFEYVLHPRTTGWVALCSRLRGSGLESIYDVTVVYDKPAQTEADLLRGHIPGHVYFYFKRYPIEQLPEYEEALKAWLNSRWREKEASLRYFHEHGEFLEVDSNKTPTERAPRSLRIAKLAFVFWTVVDVIFLYSMFRSTIFQYWVIYHSLVFVFVTWKFGGFQNIQYIFLENVKI